METYQKDWYKKTHKKNPNNTRRLIKIQDLKLSNDVDEYVVGGRESTAAVDYEHRFILSHALYFNSLELHK